MRNLITNIFLLFTLFCCFQNQAQEVYYKMPDGKIQNGTYFKAIQEGVTKNGNIKIEILDYLTKSDSIIKEVKFSLIDASSVTGGFDPYATHRKLIGSEFKIENFKNDKGVNYKPGYLKGKPTLISFWFTKCPPCIEEIPNLNKIQTKYENKVNFIAITFDNSALVDAFLKKRNIQFEHIVDSQKQLDDLKIEAYPMNYLLDTNGKITEVYGEISYDEKEIMEKIDNML